MHHVSATGVHTSSPSWTSFLISPLRCHRALNLGSLHHTANSHWLSILHMVILMSQCYPPDFSPFPTVSTSLFTMLMLPLPPSIQVHQCRLSRFHIYTLIHDNCFSLSDLLHSVLAVIFFFYPSAISHSWAVESGAARLKYVKLPLQLHHHSLGCTSAPDHALLSTVIKKVVMFLSEHKSFLAPTCI